MRGLSLIIVLLLAIFSNQSSDSPHGKDLEISCDACHNSQGWKIDRNNITFNHNLTQFQLEGMHEDVSCVSCHPTLVFSDAEPECVSCHTDMHQQTVGFDCARCHTTNSWIVENITEIHQQSRFPLLGPHITADCYDCHQSASLLLFEPLGVECIDCHRVDYMATTDPNHVENDYSTNCIECHKMNGFSWVGADFAHTSFPLIEGHAISDCRECHTDPQNYSNISTECYSCHQADYIAATVPNHQEIDLSTNCTECHTLSPGWRPAEFPEHDVLFPIYSGEHNGEWGSCIDCHNNPGNIAIFTCIDCHEHNKGEMDDEHQGIGGYLYDSYACLECHPTGSEDGFDHNVSAFPLTGAHIETQCIDCHSTGYSGTTTICFECHTLAYNQTTNPNHLQIEISNDCETCHTTDPGWQPALFDEHNEYYVLSGAHITTLCADCHIEGYIETPNICFDCHTADFNESTEPNHVELGFPTDCEECHTTAPEWKPTTYNHDEFYPLTGAHITTLCIDCHSQGYEGTPNTCFECHESNFNQTTNPNHVAAGLSNECQECHTTNPGWTPATFADHNNFYVLAGAHSLIANDCNACHNGNYNNTPNTCVGCHLDDYNQTTNPPHEPAQFSTDCLLCHTEVAWEPSTFDHDNQYFPIYSGGHEGEWNQCSECHTTPTNYALFSCIDCHEHNKPDMDEEHKDEPDYTYNSDACFECHPLGESKFIKPRIQYRIR